LKLKDKVIHEIIDREGGFVDDDADSGGATCWGITEDVARAEGYKGDMRHLPKELAYKIYERKYWHSLALDSVAAISESIAAELADTGVNMGVQRAGEFLQRALNALNNQQVDYKDLIIDGKVGRKTLENLIKFINKRGVQGEIVLFRMLNCLQGEFYITIGEKRQKDEKFIFGWFLNRVS
jgi:lysozyme family protein